MFRIRRLMTLMAVLAVAAILGTPMPARAGFAIRVSDGTHSVTISDNQVHADSDPTTGSIVVTTSTLTNAGILGWSAINVSTAYSNFGTGESFAMLEIGTSAKSNSTGPLTTLTIDVSQTGFTQPASQPSFIMMSQVVATSVPGTETVQGFYDSGNGGNNAFSIPGGVSTNKQTVTNGVTPDNPDTVQITPGASPFSLNYREVLSATAGGQFFSTDNQLTVVAPAPSSATLIGCGTICLFFGYACKRRRMAAA